MKPPLPPEARVKNLKKKTKFKPGTLKRCKNPTPTALGGTNTSEQEASLQGQGQQGLPIDLDIAVHPLTDSQLPRTPDIVPTSVALFNTFGRNTVASTNITMSSTNTTSSGGSLNDSIALNGLLLALINGKDTYKSGSDAVVGVGLVTSPEPHTPANVMAKGTPVLGSPGVKEGSPGIREGPPGLREGSSGVREEPRGNTILGERGDSISGYFPAPDVAGVAHVLSGDSDAVGTTCVLYEDDFESESSRSTECYDSDEFDVPDTPDGIPPPLTKVRDGGINGLKNMVVVMARRALAHCDVVSDDEEEESQNLKLRYCILYSRILVP